MFPTTCLVMRFGPRQVQEVGQKAFRETVATNDAFGELLSVGGQLDAVIDGDEALGFEALHHFAHGWSAHLQTFGDPRLDDVDVILTQLEDALAVLLEGRMVFSGMRHKASLPHP